MTQLATRPVPAGPPTTRAAAEPVCWNTVAERWPNGRDALWRAHSDAVNLALCRRWLPRHAFDRLLKTDLFDEATGVGLTAALGEHAQQVIAIDCARSMAAGARARGNARQVAVADVRTLPFASASIDAIVSNSTLDHFAGDDDIARSLAELRRILTPGGQLVLTLDNGAHPLVALRNALPIGLLMRTGIVPYYVGRTLTPKSLAGLLAATGFEVREMTAILHCPRVLVVPLARMAGRRGHESLPARSLRHVAALCEGAQRLPTRYLTGHFIAVLGQKR